MAATTSYVQVSDVITMLPGLANSPAANASLEMIAKSVSATADQFTGRTFWIQNYTETFKGRGQNLLIPIQQPVVSITTLSRVGAGSNSVLQPAELDANGVPLTGGGFWTSTDSSGITIIYLGGGMRICDSNSPSVFLNYTAGYAALTGGVGNGPKYEDLPGDFYQALCYECATRYKELSRLGSKSEVTGQGQSMFFNTMDLQAQTKGTLGRYARGYYTLA